jgi:hypothetical protein
MMISEITTGDHSKRADGRKRACLRTAQRVLVIAVAHEFPIDSARQVEVTRERLTRIKCAVRPPAIWPARLISRIAAVITGIRLPRVAWTAAEVARVIIAIARAESEKRLRAAERHASGPEGRSFESSRPALNIFHCSVSSHARRKYSGQRDIRLNRTAHKNDALKKFADLRQVGTFMSGDMSVR